MPGTGIAPAVTNLSGNSQALSTVNSAISDINSAYSHLTSAGQQAVGSVSAIEIDPASSGRSYVDVESGTFHLNVNDVLMESSGYVAADILHDGFHIVQYESGLPSTGIQAEQDATNLELLNGSVLGLTPTETQFLHDYMNDPVQIQTRIDEPVSTGAPDGSLDLGLFTFTTDIGISIPDLFGSDLVSIFTFEQDGGSGAIFGPLFTFETDPGTDPGIGVNSSL